MASLDLCVKREISQPRASPIESPVHLNELQETMVLNLKSRIFYFYCFFAFVGGALASPPGEFNVNDFGAKPDGTTESSKAFLDAWTAACGWNGTSRVVIPTGTFLVGPVQFGGPCKNVTTLVVQVKGTVKATTDLSQFRSKYNSWMVFHWVDGLILSGGGTFDGQGASAWPHSNCQSGRNCKLPPTSLRFCYITNGTIREIKSVDSKSKHITIYRSHGLNIHDLRISAPDDSPNTDGIHISRSSGINISHSIIGTGDDCIAIGAGTSNISISDVSCGPGHGISVGSLGKYQNEEDVRGLTVKNCTLSGTTNGVRIKTWPGSLGSLATNLTFQTIVMKNVSNPIIIDQQYCPRSSCTQMHSRVKISDVSFKDITGTSFSEVAVNLLCSKEVPCQNIDLLDINLKSATGSNATSSCSNVKGASAGLQNPPPCF